LEEETFDIYVKCSDDLLGIFEPRFEKLKAKVTRITDHIPLDFFANKHPVIWELDDDDPQALKNFLDNLRESDSRQVYAGSATEIADSLENLEHETVVLDQDEDLSENLPLTKTASIISSLKNVKKYMQILNSCGYDCWIDNIPLNRDRVEKADLVILIPDSEMFSKYNNAFDILKNRMGKNALLLSVETPFDDLTQHLVLQGEFSAWSPDDNLKYIDTPALVTQIQNYAQTIFNIDALDDQLADLRKEVTPDSEISRIVAGVKIWLKKWRAYSSMDQDFTSWKEPKKLEEQDKKSTEVFLKVKSLATAFSILLNQMIEQRKKVLEESKQILKDEAFLKPWEPVLESAENMFNLLLFRQAIQPLVHGEVKKLRKLVRPETPQGWLPKSDEKEAYRVKLKIFEEANSHHKARISTYERERGLMTQQLVEHYWKLYEEVALGWIDVNSSLRLAPELRLFLRLGYIGNDFFSYKDKQIEIIKDLASIENQDWNYNSRERQIIFMDDLIEKIVEGQTGTSVDENLELMERGSDAWKTSRNFRLTATIYRTQNMADFRSRDLEYEINNLNEDIDNIEVKEEVNALMEAKEQEGKKKKKKKKESAFHKQLREHKVRRTRLEEHLDKCYDMKHSVPLSCTSSADKAPPTGEEYIENLQREIKLIRRFSKLCSRRKEYFIPDVLLKEISHKEKLYTRETLQPILQKIESQDQTLFEKTLVNHPKRDNRLEAKMSPTFIVLPGSGQFGFCMEGMSETQEGRLAIPLIMMNNKDHNDNLVDLLSDYRWDTCMNDVGADWATSKSIVGSYSQVRWATRNLDLEDREKSLIFKDESDKKNFRRHYRLYVKSAKQQGRLLYYKNKSIYEAFVKYIPLPKGVAKLTY